MIHYSYSVYNCAFLFRLSGSVFPFGFAVAFPCTLAAALMKGLSYDPAVNLKDLELLAEGGSGAWSGFNFLVGFVIVFRTSQAYNRFWSALGDTHQMVAAWQEAASSLLAFSRSSTADLLLVENWLHTVIRLFSLLSASALQELTDVSEVHTWGLPTLDASAIDPQSIKTLDASTSRVELLYNWVQQFIAAGAHTEVLTTPPPLVSRTYAQLAYGMSKYHDAMKHSKVAFPFPYAQTTLVLLIFHWILTPLVMVQWTNTVFGASIFTFVQVFTLWCLNATAVGFEQPFGGDANDIDHMELQMGMNKGLINLMEPRSRRLPFIPTSTYLDIDVLRKRDTIHAAALQQEGWELRDFEQRGLGFCQSCCGRRRRQAQTRIAVSTRYSSKRYCEIDGQRTAVLTIGIVGSELCLALPARANDTKNTFEVLNVEGRACTLRAARIPIQQRHSLTKSPDPAWNDDFLDFPADYNFSAEALAKASERQRLAGALAVVRKEDDEAKVGRGVSQHLGVGDAEVPPAEEPLLPGSVEPEKPEFVEVLPVTERKSSQGSAPEGPKKEMVLPWGSAEEPGEKKVAAMGGQVVPWGRGEEAEPVAEACDTREAAADPSPQTEDLIHAAESVLQEP